jgi:hypothetical protein
MRQPGRMSTPQKLVSFSALIKEGCPGRQDQPEAGEIPQFPWMPTVIYAKPLILLGRCLFADPQTPLFFHALPPFFHVFAF